MMVILQKEYTLLHKKGGKPPRLTVEDKLYITLKYLREYRTMESIGAEYGVGRSAVCESIQWVEDTLAKDKTFRLPDKKVLKKESPSIEYIVVDVTESPINRPKKTKKSGIRARKSGIR
ncbi:transposase [Spirochaetia bacterium]|nr:transposase [Spirochaetia bacterium]